MTCDREFDRLACPGRLRTALATRGGRQLNPECLSCPDVKEFMKSGEYKPVQLCSICGKPPQKYLAKGMCKTCYDQEQARKNRMCPVCGLNKIHGKNMCIKCYHRDRRQKIKIRPVAVKVKKLCQACGEYPNHAKGMCNICYSRDKRQKKKITPQIERVYPAQEQVPCGIFFEAMADVFAEIERANSLHSSPPGLAELVEEVGEVASAIQGDGNLYEELSHVACVAVKMMMDLKGEEEL